MAVGNRKCAVALVAMAALGGCATQAPSIDTKAAFVRDNCGHGENYQDCTSRITEQLNREGEARDADPAFQARVAETMARTARYDADKAYCHMQAQAMVNQMDAAVHPLDIMGGIVALSSGNQNYADCMNWRAAERAATP